MKIEIQFAGYMQNVIDTDDVRSCDLFESIDDPEESRRIILNALAGSDYGWRQGQAGDEDFQVRHKSR